MVIAGCFALAGCSTTVYKDDVGVFSNGVDEAAEAFNGLHAKTLERYRLDEWSVLAGRKAVVKVSKDCTSAVTEGQLVRDSNCLASWAAYRALPEGKRGERPRCLGASERVRSGEYAFYDLAELATKEANACKLAIEQPNGSLDPQPLDSAEVLLVDTPRLLLALKGYASGLVGIADATDRTELTTSVGKAKDQLEKLGKQVDALDGKTSPSVSTIGPIADIVGSAFIYALEVRRYKAMKSVTAGADPVVAKAAVMLSNVAVPMTAIELQDLGVAYLEALPDPKASVENEDAWLSAYAAARAARQRYLAAFQTSPTAVFKAMAIAHHELTLALADPERQYESVSAAVADFAEKAGAAYDAIRKARAESKTPQ